MNETLKTIESRRSIRRYRQEQIADAELQQILNAAIYAPSAVNQQKWRFTAIQNKDMLHRMVGIIKTNIVRSNNSFLAKRAASDDYDTFYHAPTVILISGEDNNSWVPIDCGLAAENIALAAESLGIGSCIITSSGFLFASEEGSALSKELGIPEGYSHICTVAIGYKDGENPPVPPRNREVISYIK